MTIPELKASIKDFIDCNTFDYERRTDPFSRALFNPPPDSFEIFINEKTNKRFVAREGSIEFKEESPCRRTSDIAHAEILRIAMSGISFPEGTRAIKH